MNRPPPGFGQPMGPGYPAHIPAPPPPPPPPTGPVATPSYPEGQIEKFDLASYVYNAGFIHAAWADTFVNIPPHPPLRLHALFASRSPLLYNILVNYAVQGPPYHINIPTDDRFITAASLSMTLATLYGHTIDPKTCDLAISKGLVATGSLFGLADVAAIGYQAIINNLSLETLDEVLAFALSSVVATHTPTATSATPSENGAAVQGSAPSSPSPSPSPAPGMPAEVTVDDVQVSYPGPYPRFTDGIVSACVDFILTSFDASQRPVDPAFKAILLSLPFHIYKHICESDKLAVKSQMERHAFAREITAMREHHRRSVGTPAAFEETVVLAFGGGKGGVEVIRKPVGKRKTLWKAGQ